MASKMALVVWWFEETKSKLKSQSCNRDKLYNNNHFDSMLVELSVRMMSGLQVSRGKWQIRRQIQLLLKADT